MTDILEEKDWDFLLLRKKYGNCIPFLRSEAFSEKTPVSSQIANELLEKYTYPIKDSYDKFQIHVFCHDYRDFAAEFKTRWEVFNRGI